MPTLFEPITVGTMHLDHRIVFPPHSGGRGSLTGTPEQFERYAAYWVERIRGGVQWVGGAPNFIRNPLIPGFEPTGVGASGPGTFRHPLYVERLAELSARIHAAGGYSTVQMVLQGGASPLAPSATLSGYHDHDVPHVLDADEIAWLVREYGESARLAADGDADVIELHANHDDVLQWFLSPLTNHRTDAYGGGFENRRRLLREVVESIRAHAGRPITVGLRLCLDEMIDGGYGPQECRRLLEAFTAEGTVDYFSLDVGNNWGAPSYVPPDVYGEAPWAQLCGEVGQATDLPVLYVGRVTDADVARRILAAGQADLVGLVRAQIAEPDFVELTRSGRPAEDVRPCIGIQDCLGRRVVESLPFACAVNPQVGRESEGAFPVTGSPRRLLVIGGGPGGTETAALAAERGHQVTLWEQADHLGGQLAVAAKARMNHRYAEWIDWQRRRLDDLGVQVDLGRTATAEDVVAAGADVVVVATGARPRLPRAGGLDAPHVVTGEAALTGTAPVGRRVLVVSEDDRPAPIAIADHLTGAGHEVTMIYRTTAPTRLVHKYAIGAVLARLDTEGATLVPTTRLTRVEGSTAHLANTYSGREWMLEGIDTVVLACGSVSDDALYLALKDAHPNVHRLGDAYAPRRMTFATRQAWSLVATLDR
ncbi:oxidoreductase [Pseudonocardia parietis]|uniref:2,4-dienoyl-CoA reductase-like NADH-dependent reductase (Old Yellow Enzyme family)/thioredoxin reductase n=1 Tax=Pseudonocardia parietis TaxID=570936 RepID=A0ABS4VTK4_9PSEU|nr:FAD-dependent oxidoreductase [Pseudonocardia parietis]MBP2367262.1 2,4-dienoyl-CoA reductase-like NADH-dependent reductase (Old Yellow Enzyme family)/thioredoxin reductase [Pseudonocardia parietis]